MFGSSILNTIFVVSLMLSFASCGVTTGNPSGEGPQQGLKVGENNFEHELGIFTHPFEGKHLSKIIIRVVKAYWDIATSKGKVSIEVPLNQEIIVDPSGGRIGDTQINLKEKFENLDFHLVADTVILEFATPPGADATEPVRTKYEDVEFLFKPNSYETIPADTSVGMTLNIYEAANSLEGMIAAKSPEGLVDPDGELVSGAEQFLEEVLKYSLISTYDLRVD